MKKKVGGSRSPGGNQVDKRDLQKKLSRMQVPLYDGSDKMIARACLQKLQTYVTLSPMIEEDTMQFTTLHLEGVAYDWWHHGLITQGHNFDQTLNEFIQRIQDCFNQKNEDENFQDLVSVRQKNMVDAYILEFQRIVVMVPNIYEKRVTFLFMEGLLEPLTGMVKTFSHTTLQDAIKRALTLEPSMMRPKPTIPPRSAMSRPLQKSASYSTKSLSHS